MRYKLLNCYQTPKGVFCEVEKDGKRLTGVHLDSLLKSRFYKPIDKKELSYTTVKKSETKRNKMGGYE